MNKTKLLKIKGMIAPSDFRFMAQCYQCGEESRIGKATGWFILSGNPGVFIQKCKKCGFNLD